MPEELRTELHPDFAELIEEQRRLGVPRSHQVSPEGARELIEEAVADVGVLDDPEPVGNVREYPIPGPDEQIPVRIYTPEGEGPFPVLVWLHGGGWIRGSIDAADATCRAFVNEVGCTVVSVGYRLAPECTFPAGLRDCYAAVEWVEENPDVVLGDGEHLAVGGSSAGGNLTVAVSLMARDRDGPKITYQLADVPVLDYNFDTASYRENAEGFGLKREDMRYYWEHYLHDPIHGENRYASPLQARDLSGLPAGTVITCGFDVLRDEGIEYAERLKAAGVPVEHNHYPDSPHALLASTRLTLELEPSMEALADTAAELRAAFER